MCALFAGSSGTPAQYIAFTTIGNGMLHLNPPSTAGLSHNHGIRTANEGFIQPNLTVLDKIGSIPELKFWVFLLALSAQLY